MKRITLDQAWIECLRMCRATAKRSKRYPQVDIARRKAAYCKEHNLDLQNNFWFCGYSRQYKSRIAWVERHYQFRDSCSNCPGRKIEPGFSCMFKPDGTIVTHHWSLHPVVFLRKLEKMYPKWRKMVRKGRYAEYKPTK